MCQIIHVEDLQEETRELLEEHADTEIVTQVEARQCERNWEQGVQEVADCADLMRSTRRFFA